MSLKGNLESFELTAIFQLLKTENKTGLLQFQDEAKKASVFIKEGDVAYATDSKADTRMGYLLRSSNVITDTQLEQCLKLYYEGKQDFGKILVDNGFITAETLEAYVIKQTENIVFDLFFWEKGDFVYKDVGLNPQHMLLIKLNTMQILLEGSRRVDEMYTLKKLIPSDTLVFKRPEVTKGMKDDPGEQEQPIFCLINGSNSVRQVIDESGYDLYSVYMIFNSLFTSGFIEPCENVGLQKRIEEEREPLEGPDLKTPPKEPDSVNLLSSSSGTPASAGIVRSGIPSGGLSYDARFYSSLVGKQLGNYGTISFIGYGSKGGVFRGWDVVQEREVALKVISYELSSQETFCNMFIKEARMLSKLYHPNIVQIYYAGSSNDILYYTMEFIDGHTLEDLIRKQLTINSLKGIEYLITVCKTLDFVSKNHIIHRDINPKNIMVDKKGAIKLVDFGVAKLNGTTNQGKQKEAIMGCPLYMSPDWLTGQPLDCRSDIYSLGASFYHAFTGYPPFEGDSTRDVLLQHLESPLTPLKEKNPKVSNVLGKIVEKMMAKSPQDRYQDYHSIINDIDTLQARIRNRIKNRS